MFLYKPGVHGEQVPSLTVDPVRAEVMPVSRRHQGLLFSSNSLILSVAAKLFMLPSRVTAGDPLMYDSLMSCPNHELISTIPPIKFLLSISTKTSARFKLLLLSNSAICRKNIYCPIILQLMV